MARWVLTTPLTISLHGMFELAHVHALLTLLLQGVGYDLLFLQGVTVILTVRSMRVSV